MNGPVAAAPVFESSAFFGRELEADEVPRLQALFDANPDYFLAISGQPPRSDEAQREFDEVPPAHLAYSRRWFIGLFTRAGRLVGVAIVLADLCAAQVWHLALYLIETPLHGQGVAREIYAALERWVKGAGAQWLRLGVVVGNERAERFWSSQGFRQVRVRVGVDTGGRINTVRVLGKPLGAWSVADYFERVPRDRPDSRLP